MAHARQSVVAMGDLDDIWSNQFWSGPESPGMEAGVDVVLARLKSGTRALEDLRAFYKERASIEEEYSKRLSRLARQPLGRDETGTMRAALDRVRQETAKAGDAHDKLAHMVRTALEVKAKEFEQGRDQKRRNSQAAIEKSLKNKANQEAMVVKAREKYKADCVAINGYTAQTSLVQGRDLDKAQAKLDKAQATVATNEKEYKMYLTALRETTSRWVMDWKAFCDLAQDLEEERLNFTRVSLWDYANGVSYICVTDDEFCENIRKSLEGCDAYRDLAEYVKEHRTGRMIPDPPIFVDYGKGDHIIRPTAKTANFARSSAAAEIRHTGQSLQDLATAIKPVQMAMQPSQYAALGSAGRSEDEPSRKPTTPGRSRSQSHSSTRSARSRPASFKTADAHDDEDPDRTAQDISRPSSRAQSTSRTASRTTSPAPPQARPVHSPPAPESVPRSPATTSMRSEGGYGTAKPSRPTSVATKKVDPLEEGLAALRNPAKARELYDASPRASSRPASQGPTTVDLLRKKSSRSMYSPQAEAVPSPMQASSSQPGRSSADNRNRRVSQADMYVDRRYASPQQHQDYHGSTPISPHNIPAPASTHGSTSSGRVRASSPGPAVAAMMQPPSRSPSPRPDSTPKGELDPAAVVTSYGQAFPGEARRSRTSSFSDTGRPVSQASYHQTSSRPGSISNTAYQQAQQHHQRVASSSRAQSPSVYATQSPGGASSGIYQIQQPRQPGYYEHQPPSAAYSYNGSARTTSSDYRQSPVSPAQHSVSSQQFQPGLTPAQLYAQQASDQTQSDGIQRVASAASYGAHPPTTTSFSQSHTLTPDSAPHHGQQAGQMQSEPSRRAPSPAPAPQGRPVLFFVRAMYDYEAQDPEEFSFQANDIIAVHQTDSSGWWTGELLDENRRFLGRTIFPSNFCTLLE